MSVHMSMHMSMRMSVYVPIHLFILIHTHICRYTHVHPCLYTCRYTHVFTHMSIHMSIPTGSYPCLYDIPMSRPIARRHRFLDNTTSSGSEPSERRHSPSARPCPRSALPLNHFRACAWRRPTPMCAAVLVRLDSTDSSGKESHPRPCATKRKRTSTADSTVCGWVLQTPIVNHQDFFRLGAKKETAQSIRQAVPKVPQPVNNRLNSL